LPNFVFIDILINIEGINKSKGIMLAPIILFFHKSTPGYKVLPKNNRTTKITTWAIAAALNISSHLEPPSKYFWLNVDNLGLKLLITRFDLLDKYPEDLINKDIYKDRIIMKEAKAIAALSGGALIESPAKMAD
jgi:hypothetical protein